MQSNNTHTGQDEILSQAADEYFRLVDAGKSPDIETFLAEYPLVADALRRLIPALDALRNTTGKLGIADENLDTEVPLGDFLLRREIGRGGMGVVYEATQLSLSRRVALKVLPFAATLDETRIKRFRNESLAVAALDHPNIVDVYGVGCERGVHYYAMRFIDGCCLSDIVNSLSSKASPALAVTQGMTKLDARESSGVDAKLEFPQRAESTLKMVGEQTLNTFSDRGIASFRAIASVIAQIARALEHAHRQGIVHRDIKPGNLMIDANGKPWVTDFGLAQFVSSESLTLTGDLLGTLRYMSPEQVSNAPLDYRTDIYSLGATVYELLTLQAMFPGDNKVDLLQRIRHDSPQRPSRINASIPRELETIILKATAKEAFNRYSTAAAFADDLQAWLDGKPIAARPISNLAKAWRWCKRNPVVAGMLATILFLSVGISIASTIVARQLGHQRDQLRVQRNALLSERNLAMQARKSAEQAGKIATQQAASRREIIDTVVAAFGNTDLRQSDVSGDLSAFELLNASQRKIESPDFTENVETKNELKAALGKAYLNLGRYFEAIPLLEETTQVWREQSNEPELANDLGKLSICYERTMRVDEAIQLAAEASELYKKLYEASDLRVLRSSSDLAILYILKGQPAEAIKTLESNLKVLRAAEGDQGLETLIAIDNLSSAYRENGELELADQYSQEALAGLQEHFPEHPVMLEAITVRSILLEKMGRGAESQAMQEENYAAMKRKLSLAHGSTLSLLGVLADRYVSQGRLDQAIELYEEAIPVLNRDQSERVYLLKNNLGQIYQQAGRFGESLALFKEVVAYRNLNLPIGAPERVVSVHNLATGYMMLGDFAQATPLFEDLVRSLNADGDVRQLLIVRKMLATCYQRTGQVDRAIDSFRESVEMANLSLEPTDAVTMILHSDLAGALNSAKKFEEAEQLYRIVLELQASAAEPPKQGQVAVLNSLAVVLQNLNRNDEAITLLEIAFKITLGFVPKENPDTIRTMANLGGAYAIANRLSEGEELLSEAVAMARQKFGDTNSTSQLAMENYQSLLLRMRNYGAAKLTGRDWIAALEESKKTRQLAYAKISYAEALIGEGDYQPAEDLLTSTLNSAGISDLETALAKYLLGWLQAKRGAFTGAEQQMLAAYAEIKASLSQADAGKRWHLLAAAERIQEFYVAQQLEQQASKWGKEIQNLQP